MKNREIKKAIRGKATTDGAGVHLTRILDVSTVKDFDPFLMLDSFDSLNPADYMKGFPWHPHRGIETFTYLIRGKMAHQDSIGNKGLIAPGEAQWMTSGAGVLHEEMPEESERMLGFQLWVNLPQKDKMTEPAYHSVESSTMEEASIGDAKVKVLAGTYQSDEETVQGFQPLYVRANIYDVQLPAQKSIQTSIRNRDNVFVFFIEGEGNINGQHFAEKTAILFQEDGDGIEVSADEKEPLRFIVFSAPKLEEPVSWGGPIVMNTPQELQQAFDELDQGTFIKRRISIDR